MKYVELAGVGHIWGTKADINKTIWTSSPTTRVARNNPHMRFANLSASESNRIASILVLSIRLEHCRSAS